MSFLSRGKRITTFRVLQAMLFHYWISSYHLPMLLPRISTIMLDGISSHHYPTYIPLSFASTSDMYGVLCLFSRCETNLGHLSSGNGVTKLGLCVQFVKGFVTWLSKQHDNQCRALAQLRKARKRLSIHLLRGRTLLLNLMSVLCRTLTQFRSSMNGHRGIDSVKIEKFLANALLLHAILARDDFFISVHQEREELC